MLSRLIISIGFVTVVLGQPTFTAHSLGNSEYHQGMISADMDNDGDIDLIAPRWTEGDAVVWYDNDGSENFTLRSIAPNHNYVQAIDVSDLDKDGDLDLYVANYPITPFDAPRSYYYYKMQNSGEYETDNLYRNDGSSFTRVTEEAGLRTYGLTLSATVGDLNKHKFISFGKGAPSPVYNPDWALKLGMHDGKKRKPTMKVNSVMGLLLAVESGVGLAALPEYLVSNSSNVIKVLPKSEGPITEAHFVYPQSLKNTARVQAFRNFLFSKIGDWKS